MKRALFIRMDRIGDLVLTLPCDHLVKETYEPHWVVPSGLEFVIDSAIPKRPYLSIDKKFSWSTFSSLYKYVRQVKPTVSVSYHVPWWVNMALWLARVPHRGGVQSQWHSFLFLNRGLRQKRSQCQNHEMEYNYLLTEHSFQLPSDSTKWTPVQLSSDNAPMDFDVNQDYVVVHPGMGGSALNWPVERYKELIQELSQKKTVVITGTKIDDEYIKPLKKSFSDTKNIVWLDNKLAGRQLLTLLKNADAVIAPSTGVLHLGTSLGAPSLGIFSPIKVHHSNRWGPKGEKTTVFSPEVQCPGHFECLHSECPHYFCMNTISPQKVAETALDS